MRELAGTQEIYLGDMFATGGFQKGERQTESKIPVQCVAAATLPSADLVKMDTEGCELEILRHLDLIKTQAIMLEHHSLSDAASIKTFLEKDFEIIHDESNQDVGTEIFVRKNSR